MKDESIVILNNREWKIKQIYSQKLGGGIEIDFTKMYDPPSLSFDLLMEISEKFGTTEIDFDNVSEHGCETCDYGSRYGFEIQVYGITKTDWKKIRRVE